MARKYTCYICMRSSKDFGEIDACQKQGKKNKHRVRERVTFRLPSTGEIHEGVITEVAFKKPRHEVLYVVKGEPFGFSGIGEADIVERTLATSA